MKQLDGIILEANTPDEIFEVFRQTFPEFSADVERWSLWRCFDDTFRGIRVRLKGGPTVLFGMEKDDTDADGLFWNIRPVLLAPAPDPGDA